MKVRIKLTNWVDGVVVVHHGEHRVSMLTSDINTFGLKGAVAKELRSFHQIRPNGVITTALKHIYRQL